MHVIYKLINLVGSVTVAFLQKKKITNSTGISLFKNSNSRVIEPVQV
jgi:hypothetical protein